MCWHFLKHISKDTLPILGQKANDAKNDIGITELCRLSATAMLNFYEKET